MAGIELLLIRQWSQTENQIAGGKTWSGTEDLGGAGILRRGLRMTPLQDGGTPRWQHSKLAALQSHIRQLQADVGDRFDNRS